MNAGCVVPDWLHDVFLGYGSPEAANYKHMPNCDSKLDFYDTFLSLPHVMDSFPQHEVKVHVWAGLGVGGACFMLCFCIMQCTLEDITKQVPPFK